MDRSNVHELINGENIQDDYISCLSFDDAGDYIGVGDNGGNLQVSFKSTQCYLLRILHINI